VAGGGCARLTRQRPYYPSRFLQAVPRLHLAAGDPDTSVAQVRHAHSASPLLQLRAPSQAGSLGFWSPAVAERSADPVLPGQGRLTSPLFGCGFAVKRRLPTTEATKNDYSTRGIRISATGEQDQSGPKNKVRPCLPCRIGPGPQHQRCTANRDPKCRHVVAILRDELAQADREKLICLMLNANCIADERMYLPFG
jgi:hypothetical protein